MSKFIVSGDIHLKIRSDVPEDWQLNRYRMLWKEYVSLCKKHDAKLVLSGDIFDNHKINSKEMMLFIELVTELSTAGIDTYIIDGNHDYSDASNTTIHHFLPLFESVNAVAETIQPAGLIKYLTNDSVKFSDCTLHFVGHSQLTKSHVTVTEGKLPNVLISHFRPNVNEYIREEINVSEFVRVFDLCVASDIHSPIELLADRVIYTNAPLNSHFESDPKCGCVLLSCGSGGVDFKRIPLQLPNYVQITVNAEDYQETVDTFDYYRIEVTGTTEELRNIKSTSSNTKLLKVPLVIETYVESETVIEDTRDLEKALIDYMVDLKMEEQNIREMLEVFRG